MAAQVSELRSHERNTSSFLCRAHRLGVRPEATAGFPADPSSDVAPSDCQDSRYRRGQSRNASTVRVPLQLYGTHTPGQCQQPRTRAPKEVGRFSKLLG